MVAYIVFTYLCTILLTFRLCSFGRVLLRMKALMVVLSLYGLVLSASAVLIQGHFLARRPMSSIDPTQTYSGGSVLMWILTTRNSQCLSNTSVHFFGTFIRKTLYSLRFVNLPLKRLEKECDTLLSVKPNRWIFSKSKNC